MNTTERLNVIFQTKINLIVDATYNTLLEMIKHVLQNEIEMKEIFIDEIAFYQIPLSLMKELNDFKFLTINKKDWEEILVETDYETFELNALPLEIQTAILTDIAIRYFDVVDI